MRKLAVIILSATVLSCSKDNIEPTRQNVNPTDYILTKIVQTRTGHGETELFEYNADKQVTQIKKYIWEYYLDFNGNQQTAYDTTIYTFVYMKGQLMEESMIKSGKVQDRVAFLYNELDQLIRVNTEHVNIYSLFEYDPKGRLIKRMEVNPYSTYTTYFTYDNADNLISEESFSPAGPQQLKSKKEWTGFDNQVNYARSVNGLPYWEHLRTNTLSRNNPLETKYRPLQKASDPYQDAMITEFSYTYNSAGLPIKMIATNLNWVFNLEYEKYR